MSLLSCLRDEYPPCRPLTVEVGVADRNFSNISDVEGIGVVPDTAPLKEIIKSMYMRLEDYSTGALIEQRTIATQGEEPFMQVAFNDSLSYGQYIVTVWGNPAKEPQIVGGGTTRYEFSPSDGSADDIFVCRDTITYTAGGEVPEILLRRTKGMLLVGTVNMPSYISTVRTSADGLSETVDENLSYSGSMDWSGSLPVSPADMSGQTVYTPILLPPSVKADATEIVSRYYSDGTLMQLVPGLKVNIERNKVTQLRYEWDDSQNVKIYINVDGEWEKVTSLDIVEQ